MKDDFNQISSIVVLHQDISEQKKNIIKLQESEVKYNQLFQKSGDAIILHKISGTITEVNQSAMDLFGYSAEEFRNLVTNDLHPTDIQHLSSKITQEVANGSRSNFELVMQRKDGSHFRGSRQRPARRRHESG